MKYLALAVLLAVVQAPSPVPRKTANNASKEGRHLQAATGNDKTPSATPHPIENSGKAEVSKKTALMTQPTVKIKT